MQDVTCYNCESSGSTFYSSENGFTLVRCAGCGLLYVTPRPTLDEMVEGHKYGTHRGHKKLNMSGRFDGSKINTYLDILGDLFGSELSTPKAWLDIGCGYGEFMMALQRVSHHNLSVKGLEPNLHKQASARKRGLDVSYFDLSAHTSQYDFISLLNVYSHLPNPKSALTEWRRLLKPGGELLLETGDTARFDSKDHPKPFYLPDHLSFASEEIVVSVLESSGFQVVDIKKYPFLRWNTMVVAKEMAKLFLPNKVSRIRYLFNHRVNATDMYVRARVKAGPSV